MNTSVHDLVRLRPAGHEGHDALWRMLEPTIRAGEIYAIPPDLGRDAALAYWSVPDRATFVAEDPRAGGELLGTHYLRANHGGGGARVVNCGYMTSAWRVGRCAREAPRALTGRRRP